MCPQSGRADEDLLQVQRGREGDPGALAALRERCHSNLLNILVARGATRTEAEDLLADLWADCVPHADGRPSLLERFSGRCTVQGWLATVATRRWIDLKRRQAHQTDFYRSAAREGPQEAWERIPAASPPGREDVLVEMLRQSLRRAFSLCSAEAVVILRLVYLHDVTQREIVRMLGCSEAKVSRLLSSTMREIETTALAEIKRRDPWLELTWQDLLDLCQTEETGFL